MTENPFRYGMRGYAAQRAAAAGVHQTSTKPAIVSPSMGGRPVRGVAAQRTLEPVAKAIEADLRALSVLAMPVVVDATQFEPIDESKLVADVPALSVDDLVVDLPAERPPRGTLKPCPNCGVEYRRLDRHLVRCKPE